MSSSLSELEHPHGLAKRSYVRDMFAAIAPSYDLLNHLLSLNLDRRWRRRAVDRLDWERAPRGTYLDLCAGTFDLAAELLGRRGFSGKLVGADFVREMLVLGKAKVPEVLPTGADALELPFRDGSCDGCIVGFGIRNLEDLAAGLGEVRRVLKPGGRLVILEFSTPKPWFVRAVYLFYFRRVLPLIGRLVSKHMTAYSYLPQSVAKFPEDEAFLDRFRACGFRDARQLRLSAGVVSIYWGTSNEH